MANGHARTALVKLMEIIDKNNNPIHAATALWAIGEIVKKPDQAMLEFVSGLSFEDDMIQKEWEMLREKWQF